MNMSYYKGNRNKEKTNETRFIIKMAKWVKLIEIHGGVCSECNIILSTQPWIAQFHHNEVKFNEIGILSSCSFERMKNEATHCRLICENCHRKIHEEMSNSNKSNTNKILFLEYKKTNSCTKCGYNKNYKSLDFHHINSKTYQISDLVTKSNNFVLSNIEEIKSELNKCVVLCANCHRGVHFNIDRYNKLLPLINHKKENLKDNFSVRVNHEEVLKLHSEGLSQLTISKKLKCGLSTICDILKSNNIHTIFKQSIVNRESVLRLIEEGYTNSDIHRKLGYSRQVISKIRANNG